MEGRYTGPGNTNLDFKGKSITLRSREPFDNPCLRKTIIDAEGKGVIVRFVNDEGPESQFIGFTLLAGDTSAKGRGVPGFFELSAKARPITRRLRIGKSGATKVVSTNIAELETVRTEGTLYDGRLWDGNNPFHQPAATTDYYGSGDVDNDGNLTSADVTAAQETADGLRDLCTRADVDGDGDVDNDDVALISDAVSGSSLPAWWNSLTDMSQRNSWVTKLMAVDPTDAHPYRYWYKCLTFAVQTHIHTALYRGDLFVTYYDGGQTMFNVPMYTVTVIGDAYAHGINAILVGDDPLNFDDWRFIEPQTDYDIEPGMWDMPYDTDVRIKTPSRIVAGGYSSSGDKVEFRVKEKSQTLAGYSPELVLTRPAQPPVSAENRLDFWNPRVVPLDEPVVLFECMRQDMSRITDIHLADLSFSDPSQATPLVLSTQYGKLLDVYQGPDGAIHLLWKGKTDYIPGVFHAVLNPDTRQLSAVSRASTGERNILMGRVVVTPAGEINVFWLEQNSNADHPYERGIYWTRWTGSQWQSEDNIAPTIGYLSNTSSWENQNALYYYFDVDVLPGGDLLLVWADRKDWTETAITQRRYDGTWGEANVIETDYTPCVDIVTDTDGTAHMVYWRDDESDDLVHRFSTDGYSWSAPVVVSSGTGGVFPRLTAGPCGSVYAIWARDAGSDNVPAWSRYAGGQWDGVHQLDISPLTSAWYPAVEYLPDGRIVAVWGSRADRVGIEMKTIAYAADFDGDSDVDENDFSILAAQWLAGPGGSLTDIAPYKAGDGVVNLLDFVSMAENWQADVP